MTNMAIPYSRPNNALLTLRNEVYARYGTPARPSEFVTGYKAASNFTGHNADSHGVVHAVDIFVGPGSLSEAQAQELCRLLQAEGKRGPIPGHPDRLYYIIYRDKIMGDWSGWTSWDGSGYGHYDHIHVSTCDLYWGDPAPIPAADYDSTAPWGIANAITPAATTTTPEPQELFTMGQYEEVQKQQGLTHEKLNNIANAVNVEARRNRTWHGQTHAKVNALTSIVEQLAKGQGVVIDMAAVEAAAKKGAAEALAEGVDVNVTINGQDAA